MDGLVAAYMSLPKTDYILLVLCRSALESWVKCGHPWLRFEKGSGPRSLITASCFVIALHCECSPFTFVVLVCQHAAMSHCLLARLPVRYMSSSAALLCLGLLVKATPEQHSRVELSYLQPSLMSLCMFPSEIYF